MAHIEERERCEVDWISALAEVRFNNSLLPQCKKQYPMTLNNINAIQAAIYQVPFKEL